VYFLWHFPSPHGVRPLTGIPLYGARTFLYIIVLCSDCLASFGAEFSTVNEERPGTRTLVPTSRAARMSLLCNCRCPLRKRTMQRMSSQLQRGVQNGG